MHVDVKDQKIMELGSSTTQSIFSGGFLPDEPLSVPSSPGSVSSSAVHAAALVTRMQQLEAGTLLCGAIPGTPHTHASRYYLVLESVPPSTLAQSELRDYAPLGFVTSPVGGMVPLLAALRQVPLHPRTLSPLKKVELSAASIQWKDAVGIPPSPALSSTTLLSSLDEKKKSGSSSSPLPRTAGRVRPREEEEADAEEEERQERAVADGANPHNAAQGFFHMHKRFPTSFSRHGISKVAFTPDGQVRKRRRLEGEDGMEDGASENLREEKIVDLDLEANAPFDFFKLQERVFGADLDEIKHRQDEGLQRKMRKVSKQKAFAHAYSSKLEKKRKMKADVLGKINSAAAVRTSADGSSASKREGGKRLHRRY